MLRFQRKPYRLRRLQQWQRNISNRATPASPSAALSQTPHHDEDSELDFDLDYDFNTNLTPNEDGTRTLRARKSGRSLPVSPILDPTLIAARNRYKTRKPDAPTKTEDLTPLQQALRRNPYAQALATPVRQEVITGAFLPRHFLQAFGTVFKHPVTSPSNTEPASESESKPIPHVVPVPSTRPDRTWVLVTHPSISRLNIRYSWHRLIKPETLDKLGYNKKTPWKWDMNTAEIVLQKLKHLVAFKLRGVLLHAMPTGDGEDGGKGIVVLNRLGDAEQLGAHTTDKISDLGLAAIVLFEPVSEEDMTRLRKESTEGQVYDLCALLGEKAAARIKRGTKFEDVQMMGLSIAGPEDLERKNIRMAVAGLDRLSMYMKDMQREPQKKEFNQSRRQSSSEGLHEMADQVAAEEAESPEFPEEGETQVRHS